MSKWFNAWSALGVSVALVLAAPLFADTPPPEKLLPADTLGFITLPNWDAAITAFHQNSLGRLWADPALRAFKEKFQARFKTDVLDPVAKELGLDLAEYAGLFQGQTTLAFTAASAEGPAGGKVGFVFLADTGTNSATLATNLAAWQKKWADAHQPVRPVKIRDTEFFTLVFTPKELSWLMDKILSSPEAGAPPPEPKPTEWTFGQSGSLFVISDSTANIERLLVRQAGGASPALADQAEYAGDAPLVRGSQAFAWVNLKMVFDRMAKASPEAGAEADKTSISLARFLGAAGLTGLQTLAVNLQQTRAGTLLNLHVQAPDAARTGLVKALELDPKDSSPPPFVPADTVKFKRLRLDLPKTWSACEAVIGDLSPQAAGFLKFVIDTAGKDTDPDFDLRQKLIAQLGDDLILCEKFPRARAAKDYDAPPSLVLVGARNAEKAAAAVKAIAGLAPPELARYKERDFLGRTLCSFNWPSAAGPDGSDRGTPLNYAANGDYVAVSTDAALLEEFLRGHDATSRALRDKAGLAEAAKKVGGMNTGYFSCEDIGASARFFFETAKKESFNAAALLGTSTLGNRLGWGREGGPLAWFDFYALPPYERVAKYFYFGVSALNRGIDGYTWKFFAPAPPPAGK